MNVQWIVRLNLNKQDDFFTNILWLMVAISAKTTFLLCIVKKKTNILLNEITRDFIQCCTLRIKRSEVRFVF